ncbi:MAG: terminase [Planctomycetes bacterium]|nr:terminase [Planctomycetota bacterium]
MAVETVSVEWEDTPIESDDRPYVPRGRIRQLFDRRRELEILVEGPAGTGKTRALLELVNIRAMKFAGSRHLLLRKTRSSLTDSVLVIFEDKVIPAGSPMVTGAHRRFRYEYKYQNGSVIVCGGLDNVERTFSTEYDTVSVFEATEATRNDWELLLRALRNKAMPDPETGRPFHQALADCNPSDPLHWLNQRAASDMMVRIVTRHEDNPLFYNEVTETWTEFGRTYIATLDRMSGHRRQRLRFGRWVQAEGVIYEDFDSAVHVIDRFEIPEDWRVIRSIDFGFTNPFVCQWWALDPGGRMYLTRELYHTQRIVADHAKRIVALSPRASYRTIADHDAEGRATLERAGIVTEAAEKAVLDGIDAVTTRLQVQDDGRPRIFFFRDAMTERDGSLAEASKPTCTVEEFGRYIWDVPKHGRIVKEQPVKEDDHGLDAARYAVMAMDASVPGSVSISFRSPGPGVRRHLGIPTNPQKEAPDNCSACGQKLGGLAIEDGKVTCPECGAQYEHETTRAYWDRQRQDPNFGFPARRGRRW